MVEPAFTGYLAPEEHMADMLAELGEDAELHGRLAFAPGPARQIAWVANVWHDPRRIPIASIADGARALRAIQRNWALYAFGLHRRASLIGDRPSDFRTGDLRHRDRRCRDQQRNDAKPGNTHACTDATHSAPLPMEVFEPRLYFVLNRESNRLNST